MIQRRHHNLLPTTGQTATAPTANYQDGDDGTYQSGIPGTRFVDNGDGTVSDHHTGLMLVRTPHLLIPGSDGLTANNEILSAEGTWSNATDYIAGDVVQGDGAPDALFYVCILANGPGGVGAQEPPNATYWVVTPWIGSAANLTTANAGNWSDAITDCEALDYAGFTDWRMPNFLEAVSMINFSDNASPTIHSPLVITSDTRMWTSTTLSASTGSAYTATFGTASVGVSGVKSGSNPTLIVRGGRFNA